MDRNSIDEKNEEVTTLSIHGHESDDNATSTDKYLVKWDGDDQENVRNISNFRKWVYTIALVTATFELCLVSSCWTGVNDDIQQYFGSNDEVTVLGVALFTLGIGVGPPLILAPLSEFYGRKPLYVGASVGYVAFQFGTTFAQNIETIAITRFLTSCCGSIFLSNVPASLSDLFDKEHMTLPMTIFPVGGFIAPNIAPLIAGFIDYYVNWRWVFRVMLIASGVVVIVVNIIVPETYAPVLLANKAARLRKQTGDPNYYGEFEKRDKNLGRAVKFYCTRPIMLFLMDPMMTLLCIYTGYLMAIVYFFFVAFPMVFEDIYNFTIYQVGLTFLGQAVGMGIATACGPYWIRLYKHLQKKNNGVDKPEFQLPQVCVGGAIVPVGLFIFSWTLYEHIHWIVPIIGSGIFGLGCNWTFTGIINYTTEAYIEYAASAMGANILLRGLLSFSLPMFGAKLLDGLGYHWGCSLIAFVSLALAPSGFTLYYYGDKIRARSNFALTS